MNLSFISLFSGIGGLDLGLEQAGLKCVAQVENNEFANRVLAKHWPNVKRFGDIKDVGKHNLPSAAVICGGFPCQDVSIAGRRAGLSGERSTLWKEFARVICETQPEWIVVENTRGLLSSDDGQFFGTILRDMDSNGYNAAWRMFRASQFGTLHKRERIILVANRDGKRIQRFFEKTIQRVATFSRFENVRRLEDLRNRPDIPEPLICRINNGISPRLVGIGNAVIPPLGEYIGQRIIELSD